jgi:hypothetical protein
VDGEEFVPALLDALVGVSGLVIDVIIIKMALLVVFLDEVGQN